MTLRLVETKPGLYRAPTDLAPGEWRLDAMAQSASGDILSPDQNLHRDGTSVMSCCQAGLGLAKDIEGHAPDRVLTGETLDLLVPDVHCAGCIAAVEGAVAGIAGVAGVRLNLSTRRLAVKAGDNVDVDGVIHAVENAGYACRVFDPADAGVAIEDQTGRELLRALAIAGFAAANVMLLSISIWSGAEAANPRTCSIGYLQ